MRWRNGSCRAWPPFPVPDIAHPVEANAIFVRLPDNTVAHLRDSGARFLDWAPLENGHTLVRLVTSFATPDADIERFLDIARRESA